MSLTSAIAQVAVLDPSAGEALRLSLVPLPFYDPDRYRGRKALGVMDRTLYDAAILSLPFNEASWRDEESDTPAGMGIVGGVEAWLRANVPVFNLAASVGEAVDDVPKGKNEVLELAGRALDQAKIKVLVVAMVALVVVGYMMWGRK